MTVHIKSYGNTAQSVTVSDLHDSVQLTLYFKDQYLAIQIDPNMARYVAANLITAADVAEKFRTKHYG